ncbi:unnamed protein product [marine sediment metagenome]|uniref:Type II secretion system protein GspE N-terminal domain-containing protein n=1 Tax=marine sediment metagenome TaxID=412755 RepID=X0T3A7_9ZZZZ
MLQRRIEKKIGRILIEAELITKAQLNNALKRQRENGQYLGKNLIEMGYIDEDEITQHIAEQYRIPYVSLDRYSLSKNLLDIIPEETSRAYGLIPLAVIDDILTVGIVDAPDEKVIERIQELTGFKIQVILVTAGDFNQYMQRVYDPFIVNNGKEIDRTKAGRYVKALLGNRKERRRFPRFGRKLKIKYEFRNEYNINSSINVSQGGILIKSKSPLPLDSHIAIRMELPNRHEDIIIISRVARVVRARGRATYLIGLDFSSMDAMDSRRLAEFLKKK